MTKSDLKDGMIIETRNGYTYQVYKEIGRVLGVFGHSGYLPLGNYCENLSYCNDAYFDVVAIYALTICNVDLIRKGQLELCECIWRREEPKTLEERFTSLEEKVETLMNTLEDLK